MKCLDSNNLDIHQTDVPISIFSILQVVGVHKYPVAPAWSAGDINENTLSEEATAEFGIREADIKVSCQDIYVLTYYLRFKMVTYLMPSHSQVNELRKNFMKIIL